MARPKSDATPALTRAFAALTSAGSTPTVRALAAEAKVATETARVFLAGLRDDDELPELPDAELIAAVRPLALALTALIRDGEAESRVAERMPLLERAETAEAQAEDQAAQLAEATQQVEALRADLEALTTRAQEATARAEAADQRASAAEAAAIDADKRLAAAEAIAATLREVIDSLRPPAAVNPASRSNR